jgi:hypothetical protein
MRGRETYPSLFVPTPNSPGRKIFSKYPLTNTLKYVIIKILKER